MKNLCWGALAVLARSPAKAQENNLFEISYVIEPFELVGLTLADYKRQRESLKLVGANATLPPSSLLDLKLTTRGEDDGDVLFGENALLVSFLQAPQGGVHRVGSIVPSGEPAHNCIGATHLSLWYKTLQGSSYSVMLRVSLFDDSECGYNTSCGHSQGYPLDQLEQYSSNEYELLNSGNSEDEWMELRIELPSKDEEEGNGVWNLLDPESGNGVLDLDHLRGWSFNLAQSPGSTSIELVMIAFDQLACVGDGELFGAAFRTKDSFEVADAWAPLYFQSELSENQTRVTLEGGFLDVDYVVEQSADWGGFLSYALKIPANAYYNLSNAESMSLAYNIARPSHPASERAHLRLMLTDSSGCKVDCKNQANHEFFYSFHYVLEQADPSEGEISIELQGDRSTDNGFWFANWAGVVRDAILDRSHIKGVVFEISLNNQGGVGSLLDGAISIGNLTAHQYLGNEPNTSSLMCVQEPGLAIDENTNDLFKRIYYENDCCGRCERDDNCMYALSNERDCFVAPYLRADSLILSNRKHLQESRMFYVKNTPAALGDFCEHCECRETDLTIDCRSRDLAILPKTFSITQWAPKILDLRNNTRLTLLATGALDSISESLEVVIFPSGLRYLSPASIANVSNVLFEQEEERTDDVGVDVQTTFTENRNQMQNAIVSTDDFFSDICCSPGQHVPMATPSEGLTFCSMGVETLGVDVVYDPFTHYFESGWLIELTPSSDFMAEASESPEKCAQYCVTSRNCRFFEYDQRFSIPEHSCRLLADNGTVVDASEEYADEARTEPGYVAGRPPRKRHTLDNAKAVFSPVQSTAEKQNGFTVLYDVSLGSSPLRGAVWIVPTLVSSETKLEVAIHPARMVLYDNATTVSVTVHITNPGIVSGSTESLVLDHFIESCDTAFTAFSSASENHVVFKVSVDSSGGFVPTVVGVVAAVVVVAIACAVYERRRRQTDAFWIVKSTDLRFADPPQVIGQGTFGVVLLAEYRGTQVAVKRVLPPSRSKTGSLNEKGIPIPDLTNDSTSPEEEEDWDGLDVETRSIEERILSRKSREGVLSFRVPQHCKKRDNFKLKSHFILEMRILSQLRHPCITTVMGAIVSKREEPMLIMEYMDYGSLYDLLHNETVAIEGELLLPILRDVTQGMRFLHASSPQIIHGDIKAANILVDSKFRGKGKYWKSYKSAWTKRWPTNSTRIFHSPAVADFGLSQKKRMAIQNGVATGTPFFMSPELIRGQTQRSVESDVFAFGILLFECYSRQDPYEDETDDCSEILRLVADPVVNKRPPIPPACPAKAQAIMMECLYDAPEMRPTFEELDLQLKRIVVATLEPLRATRARLARTDSLLAEVFPKHIAEALRDGKKVEPESRDVVTIFFSDIVSFTDISSTLPPLKVLDMLGRLYSLFDELSKLYRVHKVGTDNNDTSVRLRQVNCISLTLFLSLNHEETIGDAYMAVTNLIEDQPDHAKRIAEFSIAAIIAANETLIDVDDPERGVVIIRVGFHSGPVVASVVGIVNPRYCLFGDVVNTSSRMESSSAPNRIHCSERSAELLKQQCPGMDVTPRGLINIKGKGEMETFWVGDRSTDGRLGGETTLQTNPSVPLLIRRKESPKRGSPMSFAFYDNDSSEICV